MKRQLSHELERLAAALLDGVASESERSRFNDILREEPALAPIYIGQARMHALLECRLGFKRLSRSDLALLEAEADAKPRPGLPLSRKHATRRGVSPNLVKVAAVALLLLSGVVALRPWIFSAQWARSEEEAELSQRHREHGGRKSERSREEGMAEQVPVSSEQLAVNSGMGILPMINHGLEARATGRVDGTCADGSLECARQSRRFESGSKLPHSTSAQGQLAAIPVVEPAVSAVAAAPLHRDPTDQTDPSDPTDHSRDPPTGAAALAAEPTISAAGMEPAALATEKPAALAPHKEEEAGMRATQKLATAVSAAALTGMAGLHPANVTDVTITQQPNTRIVQVSYTTDGPGIATCCFYNDGAPIGAPGAIRSLYGDIHQLVGAGDHEFTWNAGSDRALPEQIFSNLTVEVTLWATNNPPEYCAVRLEELNGQYPVFWYGSENEVPFGVTNNSYKTTHLLLRKIPSTEGRYVLLGSPTNEVDRFPAREARREVRITAPFYMGVYQVTQYQWGQVGTRSNPSNFKGRADSETRPVETVSWFDIRSSAGGNAPVAGTDWPNDGHDVGAGSFMYVLREKTGGLIQFDLPTDAQWEYACRAGTTGPYNVDGESLDDLGWYRNNSDDETHAVGEKLPNGWGLYDMHGNVREWCLDWFCETTAEALPSMSGDNPMGPASSSSGGRISRGGHWKDSDSSCRSAYRNNSGASGRYDYYGFRVAAAAVVTP